MQIRYSIDLTIEEYIKNEAWELAELSCCPFHPDGGCSFAKHGTYPRKFPDYCLVVRYYCPEAHQSISLLPDFFASRFPGTLDDVEHAVNAAEASSSQEEAAIKLRPDIELPGALRWLRRRVRYVKEILNILAGLLLTKSPPVLKSFRTVFGVTNVLTGLRYIAREHLQHLPPIVGLGPRSASRYSTFCSSNN